MRLEKRDFIYCLPQIILLLFVGCSNPGAPALSAEETAAISQPVAQETRQPTARAMATELPPAKHGTETTTPQVSETPSRPPAASATLQPSATATPAASATVTLMPSATTTATPVVIAFPWGDPSLGDSLRRSIDGTVMVYVPGGSFLMGRVPDDDRFPSYSVTLDGFWIDQTEVTNGQYAVFLNERGNQVEGGYTWLEVEQMENAQVELVGNTFQAENGKADHPVVEVSSHGASAYCQWVGGRLPTEAEWEYAARGPEGHLFPWGDDPPTCERAQFGGCGDYTVPVGTLSDEGASWVGAKDMAGNVWEWVAGFYGEYPAEPQTNPTGPESGERKVNRGGSFMSAPDTLHTAYRLSNTPTSRSPVLGFRCAGSAP